MSDNKNDDETKKPGGFDTTEEGRTHLDRYAFAHALENAPIQEHQPGCCIKDDQDTCDCTPIWHGKKPGAEA